MAHAEKCPVCSGAGKVNFEVTDEVTVLVKEQDCSGCEGRGWVIVPDEKPLAYAVVL